MVFDAVAVGIVLLAAGLGAWKGFAWQVAAVVSPVAGVAAGWPLSALLAPLLGLPVPFDRWTAFAILFVLVTLIVHLLALGLRKGVERAGLRPWDRQLGLVAGGVKGCVLAVLLMAAALTLFGDQRERLRASRAGRLMTAVVRALEPTLPAAARDAASPVLQPFLEPTPPPEAKWNSSLPGSRADEF